MNGIAVVDKPSGRTSHDIVLYFRRRFHIKKVGHAGTLDPMATGVLVMLIGEATKLSGRLISDDKEYEGVLRLGVKTETCDSEGKVISTQDFSGVKAEDIEEAVSSFHGAIEQIPPMFSALKHKGKKLYELARKGVEVKREPRLVTIYQININKIEMPEVRFTVSCSKGTYIRKLADDIGEKIGCGAHLTELRRTRSGRFTIEDSISFAELEKIDRGKLKERLQSIQ